MTRFLRAVIIIAGFFELRADCGSSCSCREGPEEDGVCWFEDNCVGVVVVILTRLPFEVAERVRLVLLKNVIISMPLERMVNTITSHDCHTANR